MLDCSNQVKTKLAAYLAHELPVDERSTIRHHLEQCPDCQAELESLEQLNHLLDRQPIIMPPVDLADSILAAIAQEETVKAKDLSWTEIVAWGTGLIAGLCLLIIPALIWYWQRTTGMLPWQSLGRWSSIETGTLATDSSAWLMPVSAARQWLVSFPGTISLWLRTRVSSLASFYAGHLTEVVLVVVALIVAALLSVKVLSRWGEEWEDSTGIKGWRN